MANIEEKKRALANLPNSSRELAEKAFQAAAQLEAQADAAGIAFKERRRAASPFSDTPGYLPPASSGIGVVLRAGK